MAEKILVHLESIQVKKPEGWEKLSGQEKYEYLNTAICLNQPSVNDFELIEIKD